MDIYAKAAKTASGLLKKFAQGEIVVIRRTPGTGPAYNPGAPSEARFPIYGTASGAAKDFVDNGLAVATDLQVIIPTDVVMPEMTDDIEIDSVAYKIIGIHPRPAAGTPAVHIVIVRK